MKAVITKNITVMGDNGDAVGFKPSTTSSPFVEVNDATYARLKRAGAARPFTGKVEKVEKPVEAKVDKKPDDNKETETVGDKAGKKDVGGK